MPSKPIAIPAKTTLLLPKSPSRLSHSLLLNPTIKATDETGIPDRPVSKTANSSSNPAMDTPECRMAVHNEKIVKQTLLKRKPKILFEG